MDAFVAGETFIPASGKIVGDQEKMNAVKVALEGWFTEGPWVEKFEAALAKWIGARFASMCNSGSSANLLAISALMSPLLGDMRLEEGDEVIVTAAGFPTTLNPVIQNGLNPIFVDVELETLVPSIDMIREAVNDKTRAIFLAHTLGNPWPIDQLTGIDQHFGKFWLIEDNCDALGSCLSGIKTGTFGDLATQSFYPAHHITTGEGGAVLTHTPLLKKIVESFRDWGRDCWCDPGHDDTCHKRFQHKFPNLPDHYDHKYVYSHIGYNLKSTDFQAAIGLAQLDRLDGFIKQRQNTFYSLRNELNKWKEFVIVHRATENSIPSWFGFPITIRDGAPFTRADLIFTLQLAQIGTRLLFGGNLLRQPAYAELLVTSKQLTISDYLPNTEKIMRDTFWIGCWPGIDYPRMAYMVEVLDEFMEAL